MLVVDYAYNLPFLQLINSYTIGIEIMQGISGSIGVVMTVPFVAAIAAFFMSGEESSDKVAEYVNKDIADTVNKDTAECL